jgi:hypothetical protein
VDTFWDWFWLMIWWFVFFAYLMLLFRICADLFRDRELGGWAKAFWIIGLIVVPLLVALIYVIARGNGMAEREALQVRRSQEATDAYIRQTAGSSPATHIAEAKALHDQGVIDADEYARLKAKALA